MITFKADFIDNKYINKYDNVTRTREPYKVQLVELNPVSANDLRTLNEITELWGGKKSFVSDIRDDFDLFFKTYNEEPNKRFLALTFQQNGFRNLVSDSVIALAEIVQRTYIKHQLNYIEVEPKYRHKNDSREYGNIGTTMLNAIKELLPNKDIIADIVSEEEEFYLKNGFERLNGMTMKYKGHVKKIV